ncbi:palmitoyltransferase ZDHHC22-like [Haliotis asinina]|uniref:palmitoyltransferase ZDHHC22-like n=1 Tax=Haliotis asinina TaxID=109174 RepID=UPI00353208C1
MESGEMRQRMSLKEKFKNHYRTNPPKFAPEPKEANKVGVTYFTCMLLSLTIEGVFILIPSNFRGEFYSIIIFEVLGIFIFVQTCANWYRTWYDVANYVRSTTKEKYFTCGDTPEGWKHCFACQLDAPPRSHHCVLCNKCMLKRDHHCYFTASCIGFQNQKYFIVFCFYTVCGCALALYLQLTYLSEIFPLGTSAAIHYIPVMPVWDWITGVISFPLLVLMIHMYMTLTCLVATGMFGTWQMLMIICGKTSYEAKRNLSTYNLGTLDNLRSAFGPIKFCVLLLLAPVTLPQLGDGIQWKLNPRCQKRS